MAPRSTRPNVRSKAPATRKRGESDPNVAPKKQKTRQSKGSEDERKAEDTDNVDREVKRRSTRGKKAR